MQPSLIIGNIELPNSTILAPLAGITNLPFRLLAKQFGCGLVCSEMVSAKGLLHASEKTKRLLDSNPEEKPLSLQLFGADPKALFHAAQTAAVAGADIIDINFGCSVKKVLKTGSGSALMKSPDQAAAVMRAVRKAVNIPVTIKIRSGWDASGRQALEMATLAEEIGLDAVSVHPRTATQGFRGRADWRIIAAVRRHTTLPVIGNGDIVEPEDAVKMFEQTGCHGVMIGRAAIARPWIFQLITRLLAEGSYHLHPEQEMRWRLDTMTQYVGAMTDYCGPDLACRLLRGRLGWLAKGMPGASRFRATVSRLTGIDQAYDCIESLRRESGAGI